MSTLAPEQLVATQKAGFETTFGLLTKAFVGTEKLVELNAQAVKSTLAESQEILAKAFATKDPQELFALQASLVQPAAEKVQSYWRHVYEIISSTQAEFASTAEAQFKQQQHDAQTFVDSPAKNAPAGSEAVLSAWKSALATASEAASSAYRAAQEATKQVVDIAENNVNAASASSTRPTKRAIEQVEAVEKK
ncbi:phasin family protein [Paraburkholderia sp. GAS42]|jgi:phasin family protein|uniref:phasin family protein n=1 Tax=Paraburkholderia sp. GAS42 TaxID=3035135 RepID=UPI003D1E8907